MIEITLDLAQDLINSHHTGFYAWRAQSPIANPHSMCVFADSRWWLVERGVLQLDDRGIVIVEGERPAWMRFVEAKLDDSHPLAELLRRDQEHDRGPETPIPVSVILEGLGRKL